MPILKRIAKSTRGQEIQYRERRDAPPLLVITADKRDATVVLRTADAVLLRFNFSFNGGNRLELKAVDPASQRTLWTLVNPQGVYEIDQYKGARKQGR